MKHAPLVCGSLGALVALPGLFIPFLSDDWALIESVATGPTPRTPFGDFRPLLMVSLWIDRGIWGLSSVGFHATQVVLIALAAALIVPVVERLSGDRSLALGAGLLFALHPYHVETAAWIGSRSDPLYAVFGLLAVLAYERWRRTARRVPVAALVLLEAALLAKETAVCLPILLATLTWIDPTRRGRRREWMQGIVPLVLLAAAHFALRFMVLGGPGRTLLGAPAGSMVKNGLGFIAAAILPVDPEYFADRPLVWGGLVSLLLAALVYAALLGQRRLPATVCCAALAFGVLLIPNVVGFQRRYFFLPAAASAVILASLLRAARRRAALALAGLVVLGWWSLAVQQWAGWQEAARASRRLVDGLAQVSASPAVREIVLANAPLRVAGDSVGGDMRAALALSGARQVPVSALVWVSYPDASSIGIEDPDARTVLDQRSVVEVRLRIAEAPFSHLAGPRPPPGVEIVWAGYGAVSLEGRTVTVRIPLAPEKGRAIVGWSAGRLITLASP